jgi:hypothetical protein
MGGDARCSRRRSPRSSKIVAAESPASDSAISIDGLAMSANATRRDAVTADVARHFRSGQRETKLLLHRARQKPAHAVLLPVCCPAVSAAATAKVPPKSDEPKVERVTKQERLLTLLPSTA